MFDTVEELRPTRRRGGHVDGDSWRSRWVLAKPAITSPIIGASRPDSSPTPSPPSTRPLDAELVARLDRLTRPYRLADVER